MLMHASSQFDQPGRCWLEQRGSSLNVSLAQQFFPSATHPIDSCHRSIEPLHLFSIDAATPSLPERHQSESGRQARPAQIPGSPTAAVGPRLSNTPRLTTEWHTHPPHHIDMQAAMAGSEAPATAPKAEEDVEAGGSHTPGAPKTAVKAPVSSTTSSTARSLRFFSSSSAAPGGEETKEREKGYETDEELDHPKHPPRSLSALSSVYSGVHSVIHAVEDRLHRMCVRACVRACVWMGMGCLLGVGGTSCVCVSVRCGCV